LQLLVAVGVFSASCLPVWAENWVLVRSVDWASRSTLAGVPDPLIVPHGRDGVVKISQHKEPPPGFLRWSYEPPEGKAWKPCQTAWTTFLNSNDPDSWCDPQTRRPTPVEALKIENVNLYSEKQLKAKFVFRANAPASAPLVVTPIMWQWWYIHNYRIFSCDPVELHSNIWITTECVIRLPTTKGLAGPKGEDYTGIGVDFAGPYGGTFDIATMEIYVRQE